MRILHLLSGGIDSVTLLADLVSQDNWVTCLLFDYKQRHAQELIWAKSQAQKFRVAYEVVALPELGGLTERSWIVPNRNAIFLSVAVNISSQSQEPAAAVTIGCNKDDADMFPDCRPDFIEAMNAATRAAGYQTKILAPYLNYTKRMIVERAAQLGVDLGNTWSCYKPTATGPCGQCEACKKREAACVGSV